MKADHRGRYSACESNSQRAGEQDFSRGEKEHFILLSHVLAGGEAQMEHVMETLQLCSGWCDLPETRGTWGEKQRQELQRLISPDLVNRCSDPFIMMVLVHVSSELGLKGIHHGTNFAIPCYFLCAIWEGSLFWLPWHGFLQKKKMFPIHAKG